MTRIVSLRAENIKRLRAVEITPAGDVVVIGGNNGAGKSSVLDAIMYGIGGPKCTPPESVRAGEEKASISIDLGDLVVTRRISANGASAVKITTKDGDTKSSPQSLLDRLTHSIAFDPLAFSRRPPKDQVAAVRAIVPDLAHALDDIDARHVATYARRKKINQEGKIRAGMIGDPPASIRPSSQWVDTAPLKRELQEAEQAEVTKKVQVAAQARAVGDVRAAEERVMAAERALVAAKRDMDDAAARLASLSATLQAADLSLSVPEAMARLRQAENHNHAIAEWEKYDEQKAHVDDLRIASQIVKQELADIAAERDELIRTAKMPVPGMTYDADGIRIGGTRFASLSHGEQLRAAVAIGLAANPGIRVLLIREGSLLDADGLRMMARLAQEYEAQIWIERVGNGDECAIIIEDGEVKQ